MMRRKFRSETLAIRRETWYNKVEEKGVPRTELFTDKLSIHIFELPKVPKELITGDTKQQWMELIKADSKEALEMVRTSTSSPDIRQGIDTIYELNADVALREQILARDKAVMDYENDMASARDEGKAEGRAEDRLEGLKQAPANLIASGMEESQAKKILGL